MLANKNIILGITGSIAAYKAAELASLLIKNHANVHVVMTKNATQFITPLTFDALTGNQTICDTFQHNYPDTIAHITLARKADLIMIAPCTANVIAKLAHGIADDILTTTLLPATCPKIIAPAMNAFMFDNPIVQENLKTLESNNYTIIPPDTGRLACNTTGKGKLPQPALLLQYILKELAFKHTLKGKNILVTAGPTQENIDPIRFITNHSSGKMGYAIAQNAMLKGANVTLISGPTNLEPPPFLEFLPVTTAEEMFQAACQQAKTADYIFKVAAVADYTPTHKENQKIKKSTPTLSIELSKTHDILAHLAQNKAKDQFICGFSMETSNLIENSRKKLIEKKIDLIVANSVQNPNSGFATDNNTVTFITPDITFTLSDMPKTEIADRLIDFVLNARASNALAMALKEVQDKNV